MPEKERSPELKEVSADSETIARFEKERAGRSDDADKEFFLCVVFQSEAQKIEFLEQLPDLPVFDKIHVDGQKLAEQLGIPILKNTVKPKRNPLNRHLSALVDTDKLALFNK